MKRLTLYRGIPQNKVVSFLVLGGRWTLGLGKGKDSTRQLYLLHQGNNKGLTLKSGKNPGEGEARVCGDVQVRGIRGNGQASRESANGTWEKIKLNHHGWVQLSASVRDEENQRGALLFALLYNDGDEVKVIQTMHLETAYRTPFSRFPNRLRLKNKKGNLEIRAATRFSTPISIRKFAQLNPDSDFVKHELASSSFHMENISHSVESNPYEANQLTLTEALHDPEASWNWKPDAEKKSLQVTRGSGKDSLLELDANGNLRIHGFLHCQGIRLLQQIKGEAPVERSMLELLIPNLYLNNYYFFEDERVKIKTNSGLSAILDIYASLKYVKSGWTQIVRINAMIIALASRPAKRVKVFNGGGKKVLISAKWVKDKDNKYWVLRLKLTVPKDKNDEVEVKYSVVEYLSE